MIAECSRVAMIQHLFNFLMGEALLENRIDPTFIQGAIQDEVVFCMVMDTVAIIMGWSGMKYLFLETNEKISILLFSSAYQE